MANEYTLSVSRDNFSKLLTLIKIFEDYCNDCDIQFGKMRCRTNDRQSVVSMDLTSIMEENPLQFSLMKNKINLLKSFELDDNVQLEDKNITIECNQSNYEIKDYFSKIIFRKPLEKYIDNKYVNDSNFDTMFQCCTEDNLIFSQNVSNYIKRRISNITQGFQSDLITCKMIDGKAALSAETRNHENSSEFIKDIILNKEITDKQFTMISMPFILDIQSDIVINVYDAKPSVYMCKFEQVYYGVPITVYIQVKLKDL